MVSNNAYVIGASPDNAQRRHLDRGELGLFAVTTSTGAEAAASSPRARSGSGPAAAFWQQFTATDFEVRSRSGTAFAGVDGEALELPTPLRFHIHPRGLTLLVPQGNLEAAERRRARRRPARRPRRHRRRPRAGAELPGFERVAGLVPCGRQAFGGGLVALEVEVEERDHRRPRCVPPTAGRRRPRGGNRLRW